MKCKDLGLKVNYEEEKAREKVKPRIGPDEIPRYRKCPQEYISKIKELRYSEKTLKSYVKHFEEFINYYFREKTEELDERQIVSFIRYLVEERKVSTSYQNISINAIKFYYEKVLGGRRRFYFIDRPKKEKPLPVVLSKEEILKIIDSLDNIKHRCIIVMAYSSGLRISEVVN